jgi:Na+/H+ antiporter NhaD/arsenite permease-like protein
VHVAAIVGLLVILLTATLRAVNVGAVALVGTFAVGTFVAGESITTLYSGFPADLFVLLFGVTYLFGIASVNGTIEWVVIRVAAILGAEAAFVPWAMFMVTATATSAGAPGPAATAIMAPVLLGLSKKYDINSRLAGLMVVHGSCAGNFSPINPIGAIVIGTVARSGLPDQPMALFAANFIYNAVLGLVIYVSFGGAELLRRRGSTSALPADVSDAAKGMNLVRLVTLVCIFLAAVGALVFRLDLGMLALSAAVVLHVLFPSTSEGATSQIGWSTIVMICGVITYMALLQRTGAVKVVGDSVVSTPTLGVLLICFVAAVTSLFAASPGVLGVVIPLSIPLLSTGAVSVTAVVIAIGISATVVDASPFSAVGALVLANCPEPERERMFRVLFWWGMAMALSAPLATWLFFILIG